MKRKIFKGVVYFACIFLFLSIYSDILSLSDRISNIETKLGGTETIACDESQIKDELSKKIVRIIGVYSEGSGFPVSKTQILTSFHVIDGDPSPKIVFSSGKIEKPVSIVGDKSNDLALITINTLEPMSTFQTPGRELRVGETVYSGGYALGSNLPGDITMSKGIYTGIRSTSGDTEIGVLQTDISLVPGMSGGPLVTACGDVIGVNTSGVAGLSLFMDYLSASDHFGQFTDSDIEKIVLDTSTPKGAVEAFYTHIMTKDLLKAYRLVSNEKIDGKTYKEWRQGYEHTLYVDLIAIQEDENNPNKVNVRFVSGDWIDGVIVEKFFDGYWIVNDELKLNESNIKQVEDPPYWWWYYWEEPEY